MKEYIVSLFTRVPYPRYVIGGVTLLLAFAAIAAASHLHMESHSADASHPMSTPDASSSMRMSDTYPDISKTPAGLIPVRDRYIALLRKDDPSSIFDVVDAIQADPKLRNNCHDIAHDIGHAAYEKYGFNGAMNFTDTKRLNKASVQDVCAGGYVHGVLEEAALHDKDFTEHPGDLCATAPAGSRASCFHGIGHALMFSNLRDTQKSLAGCRIAGNADDASRCFEGVWMEFFWGSAAYSGSEDLGWDPKHPLAACVQTSTDSKPACFLYSSFGYLRTHMHDYAGAVGLCTQSGLGASDENYCLKGVGITMITHLKSGNFEASEQYVVGLADEQKESFYKGVMGYGILSGIGRSVLSAACNRMTTDGMLCQAALAQY